MKYSITLRVKQYEKKCSVLIFLMKNEKKTEKVVFLSTISMLCSLGFVKKYYF